MFKALLQPAGSSEPVEVELGRAAQEQFEAHHVRLDGRPLEVELESAAAGSGWLRIREEVFPFHACRIGDQVQVWLRGRVHRFDIVQRTPRRMASAAGPARSSLTAPMPGTVLEIRIAPGETFEERQPLIIMESMKMEMTLSVPHGGQVGEIHCKEGQLVEMGAMLLSLRPAEKAS